MDQYLNIKLDDITLVDELRYPHLSSVKNIFIRGSVVRYVHLPANEVDRGLLEDASRRGRILRRDGMWVYRSADSVVEAANQANKNK